MPTLETPVQRAPFHPTLRAAHRDLSRLLATIPQGVVSLDRDITRSAALDRIEALMRMEHGATIAVGSRGITVEIGGLEAALTGNPREVGFGRFAVFRQWLRLAERALAAPQVAA